MEMKRTKRKSKLVCEHQLISYLNNKIIKIKKKRNSMQQDIEILQKVKEESNQIIQRQNIEREQNLNQISKLISLLESNQNKNSQELKSLVENSMFIFQNEYLTQIKNIWNSHYKDEKNFDNKNLIEKFQTYLDSEKLILEEHLNTKLDNLKNLHLNLIVEKNENKFEEIIEEDDEDNILEHFVNQQNKTFEHLEQNEQTILELQNKLKENEILVKQKEKENEELKITNKNISDELNKKILDEKERENNFLQIKEQEGSNFNEEFVKTMLLKFTHLSQNADENKTQLENKQRDLELVRNSLKNTKNELSIKITEQSNLLNEEESKNNNLRKRLTFMNKLYSSKVKEIESLTYLNSKLRKESKNLHFDNNSASVAQIGLSEDPVFKEIQMLIQKCKKLELELISKKSEEQKPQIEIIEPEQPVLEKREFIEFKPKQIENPKEEKPQIFNDSSFELDKKNKIIEQLKETNLLLNQKIFNLQLKQKELQNEIQIINEKKKPVMIEENVLAFPKLQNFKSEVEILNSLSEEHISNRNKMFERHEINLNKFVSQLSSKIETIKEIPYICENESIQTQNNKIEIEKETITQENIDLEETFKLLINQKDSLEGYSEINKKFKEFSKNRENSIFYNLQERELFFINSPHFFMAKLLEENKLLWKEYRFLKESLDKVLSHPELQNTFQENLEIKQKLLDFAQEKQQVNNLKSQLETIFDGVKDSLDGQSFSDEEMINLFKNMLQENKEMKNQIKNIKLEEIKKIMYNKEHIQKGLKIQKRRDIIHHLNKNINDCLQEMEKKCLVLEEHIRSEGIEILNKKLTKSISSKFNKKKERV